ncbi:hypothetical protein HOLleu_04256 [Holothuria leucospilota]|uniref:B box-type domain-containing protein n=1 Tax=Holothuria leucospilota TaxID=206669 RepID=A0A9Q1CUD1_HOLLE|nr:hypothetical protein HOLleu_04256 [Holothuria leucospilota]
MTALSTKFRVMLLRVGECLTENDVQNLAFLCEGIKPARRELLRNSRELFVELQGRDLLNEHNVSVLSSWLEELNLLDALRPLREYSEKNLQRTSELEERCIEHEDLVLKYFCVTCDSKVCSDCALNLHDKGSHDVIKLGDIRNEVSRRSIELEGEIEEMSKRNEALQENWQEKKIFVSNCREKVRKEIQRDIILIQEKAEKNKLSLLKMLDEKEISDFKGLMKEREDIEHLIWKVNNVKKEIHETSSDNLGKLRKLTEAKRKCTDMKEQQEQQERVAKKKRVDLLYKKQPNDGKCGILTLCSLVGGVILREDQVVHVFDERRESVGVLLICIDPRDPSKEYWRHLITVADSLSPVVMSWLDLFCNGKLQFVFAVGRTIFNVLPHWTGSMYNSVESVSSVFIDDLDEASWITSISPISKQGTRETFTFSVSNSSILREYHVSGEALRKIDAKDYASSIIGVANKDNIYAIISRGIDNVILITAESTVKQSGFLRASSSLTGCVHPVCVIWTGASWLVMFVNNGEGKEWKVVSCGERGNLLKVCCEGTSSSDMDIPVSVTRQRQTGFVTFADNTIKSFEH